MWDKKLNKFIARVESFDLSGEMERITRRSEIRGWIKDVNRMRLYREGKDIHGRRIRTYKAAPGQVYARATIAMKRNSGKPFNRVTLYQSGAFHRSIKTKVDRSGFSVKGRFAKRRGNMGESVDVSSVLGLAKADRKKYVQIMRMELAPVIRRRLLR